jgi:hypothetical protein
VNKAASELGKLGRGVPKNYTTAELERRRKRLAAARKKRWPKKRKTHTANGRAEMPRPKGK